MTVVMSAQREGNQNCCETAKNYSLLAGYFPFYLDITLCAVYISSDSGGVGKACRHTPREIRNVTKKEIVKQISERIGLTQLKTKDIVQQTFDAIVDTLLEVGRIELRNFGVFEVKQRKARKARNPRTGDKVDVPPKNVVTFKPGKEMEERVRRMQNVPVMSDDEEHEDEMENHVEQPVPEGNGQGDHDAAKVSKIRKPV